VPLVCETPVQIAGRDIDAVMDSGKFTFVLVIPPRFERDLIGGRNPEMQLNIDATAMMQAGIGQGYVSNIIAQEITGWLGGKPAYAGRNKQPRSSRAMPITRM
jgi:ABC-2 type transport system permease protein